MSEPFAARTAADGPHRKLGAEQHDAIVQGTSSDAAVSKLSCVRLGYFRDDYLSALLPDNPLTRARRAPLINRGYWARVKAITQCAQEFMDAGEQLDNEATAAAVAQAPAPTPAPAPASPFFRAPSAPTAAPAPFVNRLPDGGPRRVAKQIVSLGAGLDTTYFKLKAANMQPRLYVEADFSAPLAQKAEAIRRSPLLREMVARGGPAGQVDAAAATSATADSSAGSTSTPSPLALPGAHDYALVGADMRDLDGFTRALISAGVDLSLPTLFLAECVLIYMQPDDSNAVLSWIARSFTGGSLVLSYEQIHPFDAFGQTMIENLRARGCDLLGLTAYPTIDAHHQRYLSLGFDAHAGWDMNDVYRCYLTPLTETKRAERLELFDEMEEWNMLQAHYQISMACKLPTKAEQAAANATNSANTAAQEPATATSSVSAAVAPAAEAATAAFAAPTVVSSSASVASSSIDWLHLGLLGRSKQPPQADTAGPSMLTVHGRTIMLGGSGVRASKPLGATAGAGNAATGSLSVGGGHKGSLRRPQSTDEAATNAADKTSSARTPSAQ